MADAMGRIHEMERGQPRRAAACPWKSKDMNAHDWKYIENFAFDSLVAKNYGL